MHLKTNVPLGLGVRLLSVYQRDEGTHGGCPPKSLIEGAVFFFGWEGACWRGLARHEIRGILWWIKSVAKRHKAVARERVTSPSNLPSRSISTFSANARSDPTTAPTLSSSERLALVAVGRGTSRASNDHVAARFRARRRDCGAGLRVPGGILV